MAKTKTKKLSDEAKAVVDKATKMGFLIYEADSIIDMDEPLLGVEAREALDSLVDESGTFKTVTCVNGYELAKITKTDIDWQDEIGDELQESWLVFEVPPVESGKKKSKKHKWQTRKMMVFHYNKKVAP